MSDWARNLDTFGDGYEEGTYPDDWTDEDTEAEEAHEEEMGGRTVIQNDDGTETVIYGDPVGHVLPF